MNEEIARELLIVLCPMFPYGVKIDREWIAPMSGSPEHATLKINHFDIEILNSWCDDEGAGLATCEGGIRFVYGYSCKPYLRPMSSMTEEEEEGFEELFPQYTISKERGTVYHSSRGDLNLEVIDWLNRHFFDYHGLIDKGLALEAPEGMYDIKSN